MLAASRAAAEPPRVSGGSPAPPRVQVLEAVKAPQAARLVRQAALAYEPGMNPQTRDRDMLLKAAQARRQLGVLEIKELRRQTLALIPPGREVSWEDLRRRRWPKGGDQVGVALKAPVWVPDQARRIQAYAGFAKKWQDVARTMPRPCGYVWHAGAMAQVNDKSRYRPEYIEFEVNSKFAPLAGLMLEYIFREGWYDPARRLPLMVVRAGEDTYAVSDQGGPVVAECLSFPAGDDASLDAVVAKCAFRNLAEIYHGRHAAASNHRLGLALDLNDFNFAGVVDGPPNPISRTIRQYNREAMHRLDARQLPGWVYRAAKWLGCRLPQEWNYFGYHTDWPHIDVGTLKPAVRE